MLLLAAVVTSAIVSGGVGLALWRRGVDGGDRALAVGLLVLGGVFAWIATTPSVGGIEARLIATAPASAGPATR